MTMDILLTSWTNTLWTHSS